MASSAPTQGSARSAFLPYCLPWITEDEIAEVVDSLRSGWITTGPKVALFEGQFAEYVGVRHAIAVNSCTAALHLALASYDIGPGDEVIVPTMTFCATANVVIHLGARPVLVDVNQHGCLSVEAVERAITPRTRALIPVHYAGQPCDLNELLTLARQRRLVLIEDAAHATGAEYAGRKIGVHGDAVAFSFYATKNMTTGEGGMITTNNDDLARRIRLLSLHGMSHDAWKRYTQNGSWYYEVLEPGYKDNMTDIQAAIGIHQLKRLDGFIYRRREIAHKYDEAFKELPEICVPSELPNRMHVYHLYPIRVDFRQWAMRRTHFISELHNRGIGASVHFIPLHRHPYYAVQHGYRPEEFPISEAIYQGLVSLPLYPKMTDSDVCHVIDNVKEIIFSSKSRSA